ncbi:MAG: RNA polymerase sigma factor RpoD, partial [Rhodomicrobium sp.]|nr:RNA polymerase sigma factor RpoD [Rhodomicrobium sp.]
MASTAKREEQETVTAETTDGPLLDLSDQAVKKMIKAAKARGFITYDELNEVLPSSEVSSEQIEDIMSMLSDMGINVIDAEEVEEADAAPLDDDEEDRTMSPGLPAAKPEKNTEVTERTDDPVRMYLREMGSVELLSREGEIAIAKRIEAGREAMISGLCESPLTFQAIIIWRDELNEGKILLRDIIDLEATYSGPFAREPETAPQEMPSHGVNDAHAAPASPAPSNDNEEGAENAEGQQQSEDDLDDDEFENALSLAAMEAELKPKVLETFDTIAANYKKLRKLQDELVERKLADDELTPAQEKRYKKLKTEIIAEVKSLSLNSARIEALVEQLYDINKRLMGFEGRLLRLAESYNVKRDDFLKEYQGNELDPNWMDRVRGLKPKGWKNFVDREGDRAEDIRREIQGLASETGLEISEYRRIVRIVQKGEREAREAKREMVEANLRLVISIA